MSTQPKTNIKPQLRWFKVEGLIFLQEKLSVYRAPFVILFSGSAQFVGALNPNPLTVNPILYSNLDFQDLSSVGFGFRVGT